MSGPDPAVADVRRAVRAVLAQVDPGGLVLAACSGGPDSLALTAAVAFEAPPQALRAGAVVVDHGLQDGSAPRSAELGATLLGLGLDPVEVVAVRVGVRGGPEGAARRARYAALDEAAARTGADLVLLGHTRDDQAETVLLGLARGSGTRSLAGMPAATGRYRRPLLELDRGSTVRACAAQGLRTWDDPQNADPAYARARVRHEVLPVLESALGPGIAAALARTATLARADADALDDLAADALTAASSGPGELDVRVLSALSQAVRGRVLHRAALAAGCPGSALSAGHVRAVEALVTDWHGQGRIDLPGGVAVRRACDRLSFAPARQL